jgi:hypothetical protein
MNRLIMPRQNWGYDEEAVDRAERLTDDYDSQGVGDGQQ